MSSPDTVPVGTWPLCRKLLPYAVRSWPGMLVVLGSMLARIGFDLLRPWPMKILVDHALRGQARPRWLHLATDALPGAGDPFRLAAWCIVGTLVVFMVSWSLGCVAGLANASFGQRMAYRLAADLFGHLQRLSLCSLRGKSTGDLIRRVTTDTGSIATIVADAMLPVITSAATLATMFAVLWQLDSQLTLVSLLLVPIMFMVLRRFAEPMLRSGYHQQECDGRIYATVEQTLSAMPVVQAFTLEEQRDRELRHNCDQALSAALQTTRIQLWFRILMGLATALGTALILGLGGYNVLIGRTSLGSLLVFLSYLSSFYQPLESLAYTSSTVQGAAGSAWRVLEILATQAEVRDRPHARRVGGVRGQITIDAVTFGYEPGRTVLHGVTVQAEPGEVIAIVGPTGAGKTTLASLVPRFFDPWEGRVLVDGEDLRDLRVLDWRQHVSVVPQDTFLFPMTVAENIAYGRPHASRAQIETAAQAAQAHEFVHRLPEGYDTMLGERGFRLSGGERQRIAIARALLKDAPVLVMDEPTSALDPETESLVVQALRRLTVGRTAFIIAHRLSTIRHANRVLVLDGGGVAEIGTHQELIARDGIYAGFCRLQFGTEV